MESTIISHKTSQSIENKPFRILNPAYAEIKEQNANAIHKGKSISYFLRLDGIIFLAIMVSIMIANFFFSVSL